MKENNNRLIIIEGPQGIGKTTLGNYLRENIPSSNLYCLSGQREKKENGKQISLKMYNILLEYLKEMQNIPMDLIFDRLFFTEEVYSRLGYKEYKFTDAYEDLLNKLINLDYDIYYFSLYLEDSSLFQEKLKREHHLYQSFSINNSIRQQEVYKNISEELLKNKIKVFQIAMDNPKIAYQEINQILSIK